MLWHSNKSHTHKINKHTHTLTNIHKHARMVFRKVAQSGRSGKTSQIGKKRLILFLSRTNIVTHRDAAGYRFAHTHHDQSAV